MESTKREESILEELRDAERLYPEARVSLDGKKILDCYRGNGERELTHLKNTVLFRNAFYDPGESPVKTCRGIVASHCTVKAKYAFWENKDLVVYKTRFYASDRAPLWYDEKASLLGCEMKSPKSLRMCRDIIIRDTSLDGIESFWQVRGFDIKGFKFRSYYPFLECDHGTIDSMEMEGKYSFQHCHDITIKNSRLKTKDAFWHASRIRVEDSLIEGEYTAWYAKDLTFVRCRFKGTQPFCESRNLRFIDCAFDSSCDRAFERCTAIGTLKSFPKDIFRPLKLDLKKSD